MNKMEYIRRYYGLFDYIFWIDDDAFFMNLDKGLDEFLPTGDAFLSICESPDYKHIHTYISSGQFVLRCSERGRRFIDSVRSVDLAVVKEWWTDSLGYYTNGDQDAMVYLLKEDAEYRGRYRRWNYRKFNSRAEEIFSADALDDIFLLHFTGTPKKKAADYHRVQKYLKRSSALLKASYEKRYPQILRKKSGFSRMLKLAKRRAVGRAR